MAKERPFDPGLDTPKDREPGAGTFPAGSPYDQDVEFRQSADDRLAQITQDEQQRVAADTGSQTSVNVDAQRSTKIGDDKSTVKKTTGARKQ